MYFLKKINPIQSEWFSVCHIVLAKQRDPAGQKVGPKKKKKKLQQARDSSEYKLELSSYTKIIEVFPSVLIDKDLIVFLK